MGIEYTPSKLSTSNWSLITLIKRANCTVCMVALLPEPWKASRVGLTGPLDVEPFGGSLGVMYVAFCCCCCCCAMAGRCTGYA